MASVQEIYNEIDRINQAKGEIAGAIGEKGVDVPEQAKINEYPGYVRQIQQGSPDAVLYTPQELTPEQQAQARQNIGATAPEIFWAKYGVTTAQEVQNALDAGLLVVTKDTSGRVCPFFRQDSNFFWFGGISSNQSTYVYLQKSNSTWAQGGGINLENSGNKSQSIPTDRASENKYPSVKAVFDSLGKWGVISQTQTWTGNNNTGWDYTMSNQVYGLIPQANIDLFVSAGAVFNESTGYFELNGLTDISYNEMKEIYCSSFGKDREPQLENVLAGKACRTNYSFYSSSYTGYGSFGTTATRIGAVCKSSTIEIFNYENSGSDNSVVSKNKLFAASGGVSQAFAYAHKLHTIIGVMQVKNCSSIWMTFEQCYSLVNVKLRGVKVDVLFSHSSRLSLDSVVFLVDNATNTSAITITLHATAYARCQADTTEYTYNGQTYTGIIAYAAAKNITIASA